MGKTNASKQGVLHWLDENFEKMFLVTGLLSITLFITWQVIYRYIITQFIERAGAAVWTEELSRYIFIWISYLALSVAIKNRPSGWTCSMIICPRACSRSAGSWSRCCSSS